MTRIKGFNRTSYIVLLVLFAVTLLGTVTGLIYLDHPIARRMSQYQHTWRDQWLILGLRQLGKTWAIAWLLLLWVVFTKQSRKALAVILALLLTSFLVLPLKGLINRPRPSDIYRVQSANASTPVSTQGHSFPSGDTATVIAGCVALTGLIHRRWFLVMWPLAFGIATSRVLIIAHYLSDVFAGGALGLVCGLGARYLDERIPPVCAAWLDRHLMLVYVLLFLIPIFTWRIEGALPVQIFFFTLGLPIAGLIFIVKITHRRRPLDT